MSPQADIALPLIIVLALAFICLAMAWKTWRADRHEYNAIRARAGGSMKNVVLGNVSPCGMNGGMAIKRTDDGKIIIVRTGQIHDDHLAKIYRD